MKKQKWKDIMKKCNSNKGYLLTEMLISLLICTCLLPITLSCFVLLKNMVNFDSAKQDGIALAQMRKILSVSTEFSYTDEQLSFIYHDDFYSFKMRNKKLLLQPGTQIFLTDIKSANFFKSEGCLWIVYERDKISKTAVLTCTE